ncbi:hypothetical protein ABZ816_08310 [Actinosynnema sp. NPDC047251]
MPNAMQLHKGPGVRRPGLADLRDTASAGPLGLDPTDDEVTVLAKVVWRIGHAIAEVTRDPRNQEVLRYAYHLPRDPELAGLNLDGRLALLAVRRGRGWAANTTNKLTNRLAEKVVAHCRDRPARPAPAELRELVRAELDFRRGRIGSTAVEVPGDYFARMIEAVNTSAPRLLELHLPRQRLYFDTADERLVTVRTPALGEYLCTFLRPDGPTEYRRAVGLPPGRVRSATGRQVLDALARHPGVGLVVEPVGVSECFHWTPEDVVRLSAEV